MSISIDLITPSGQIVQAELDRMQPRHIEDFETAWLGMLQNLNQYDAFWDWAMKKRLSSMNKRFEAYAIEFDTLE